MNKTQTKLMTDLHKLMINFPEHEPAVKEKAEQVAGHIKEFLKNHGVKKIDLRRKKKC